MGTKKTLVSNDFSPVEGWTDYSDEKLDGTDAGNLAWLSRALSSAKNSHFQYPEYLKSIDGPPVVYSVDRIVYSLTPKGYEIALKQQEHTDQNQRFLQQQELNKQSLAISKSSALTAKIALFVGSAIAISSALNVYFSHF